MALQIVEFFGFPPLSGEGKLFADKKLCPFIDQPCIKPRHGSCSVKQTAGAPIICCPNRMYAEKYRALRDIARDAFGDGTALVTPKDAIELRASGKLKGNEAVLFGRYWGGELPLPRPKQKDGAKASSNYYVDWIIAKIDNAGSLTEFTAVEVQTIDTTGNYSEQATAFFAGKEFAGAGGRGFSNAGMNWENVNKRILPQIIYKGHVLGRETKCSKGLFFVCPDQVLQKIKDRLGDNLLEYPVRNGTITFRSYDLGPPNDAGGGRQLLFRQQFTTTVDQVAAAFVAPVNLPAQNVYENAINVALK